MSRYNWLPFYDLKKQLKENCWPDNNFNIIFDVFPNEAYICQAAKGLRGCGYSLMYGDMYLG